MTSIKEIALTASEKFQENYPNKRPIWMLMVELEDEIRKFTELRCKETAKNVRHLASDIVNRHISRMEAPIQITDDINRDIMNIQFHDIKPDF